MAEGEALSLLIPVEYNIDRRQCVGATHSHKIMNKIGIHIDGECVALSHNGQHRYKHRSRIRGPIPQQTTSIADNAQPPRIHL